MSRALSKRALRRRSLRWGHSVSLSQTAHPRGVHLDYPSHFKNNRRQCTRNKPSRSSLSLSLDHLLIPMDHQILGSSRPSQQLQEVRVLPLFPNHRQDHQKA